MKAGASDFIEKPISRSELLASVSHAFELSRDTAKLSAWHEDAVTRLASLTARQCQIMDLVLAGHPNKNIAADLGLSQRTVENHRAAIMKKDRLQITSCIGSAGACRRQGPGPTRASRMAGVKAPAFEATVASLSLKAFNRFRRSTLRSFDLNECERGRRETGTQTVTSSSSRRKRISARVSPSC